MPSEESKSPLVLEFNRRLKAALELTRAYCDRESTRMFNLAFSVRLTKARNAEAEENHAMLVPDADDPERSKSIKGDSQRARLLRALWYYQGALFAGMRPVIREHFKPVAQIAATLIASGTVHFNEEGVTAEAFYITDGGGFLGIYEIWGLNLLGGVKIEPVRTGSNAIVTVLTQKATLRKLRRHERAVATATAAGAARNKNDFEDAFHGIFIEEWHQLLWKAQLETKAPLQPSMQTMPAVPGDARSRALAGESKNAAAEEESAEDRRRSEVICEAVRLNKQGLEYCKYLDREQIHPSLRLQARGCPSTYEEGYKKLKKSFWKEKTRVVNESMKRSRPSPTIQ